MAEQTIEGIHREFPEQLEHLLRRLHCLLDEWRATGKKEETFEAIRECFNALQDGAQTAGYRDVSTLSRAVARLMDQYGKHGRISDYDNEQALLDMLEEMRDGLATVAAMAPDAARGHIRSLTGIVESLLPARETGTSDVGRERQTVPCVSRPAHGSDMDGNHKFSYLLEFSGELGLTRNRLGNTIKQMRRDLNALNYHVNRMRGDLQALDTQRDQEWPARRRRINLQLDTLVKVERKLRRLASELAGALTRQSHYGERLHAGLIKAGMAGANTTPCRVLLVRVGVWRFAIRATTIERAMRVADEEFSVIDSHTTVRIDGKPITVVELIGKTGKSTSAIESGQRSLVMIRYENRISAFEVDQFEGTAEVAINIPGTQLASIRGITGVTVLADGRIVPVLGPVELQERSTARKPASNTPA